MSAASRSWRLDGGFGLERLALVDADIPQPGPMQVRVRVRAVSLNYRDVLLVNGAYDPRMKLPRVPLSDAAGEVEALGPGVTRVATGDRVCPIFAPGWYDGQPPDDTLGRALGHRTDGVATTHLIVHQEDLVVFPPSLDFVQAATLPCAAVTAWHALMAGPSPVRPGQTVLIQGTGGVSLFALQLARLAGARVLLTSSDDAKLARGRALGASEGINYRETPAWGKAVRTLTDRRGVDLVVEIGGAGTLSESMTAARTGGHLAIIGVLGGRQAPVDVTPILMRGLTLQGVFVGSRAHFEGLNAAIGLARLEPVVDSTFAFEALPEALTHLASGRHFGKVTLRLDAP